MMRSMYAGVSGLKTHQTKMDVIGNNIANVNTVAYKSSSITFSELMYQTTQKSSGANALTGTGGTNAKQIGLGTKSGAISTAIESQGATQTTGNPFDICITGNSFFIVNDGSQNYFTRAGAFNVDSVGNLVMSSNGYNVMGWGVDETTGNIKQEKVTALRIMSAENMTYPPEATTKGYVAGILDKNDADVGTEAGRGISLSFYDSLGYAYTAKFSIHSTTDDGVYYTKLDDILDSTGKSITENYPGKALSDIVNITSNLESTIALGGDFSVNEPKIYTPSSFDFDKDTGKFKVKETDADFWTVSGGTPSADGSSMEFSGNQITTQIQGYLRELYGYSANDVANIKSFSIDMSTGTITVTSKHVDNAATLVYSTVDGTFSSIAGNNAASGGSLVLSFKDTVINENDAKQFEDVEVKWTATNMYNNSGTSTLSATSGDTEGIGMGRKLGNMSGVTIQTNGMIYASYDNGMTRLLGQIAVGEFTNAAGLEKAGDSLYSASLNSGEFDGVGVDISSSGGYMTTGVLEMSNVDLSSEFTEMITTQRGFQANSRVITVSDTMLEELVNLKR